MEKEPEIKKKKASTTGSRGWSLLHLQVRVFSFFFLFIFLWFCEERERKLKKGICFGYEMGNTSELIQRRNVKIEKTIFMTHFAFSVYLPTFLVCSLVPDSFNALSSTCGSLSQSSCSVRVLSRSGQKTT